MRKSSILDIDNLTLLPPAAGMARIRYIKKFIVAAESNFTNGIMQSCREYIISVGWDLYGNQG